MSGDGSSVRRHLDDDGLAAAIDEAQRRGEARLVRRLCFVRNCYAGDAITRAADRVGVAQPTGSRWLAAWNEGGVEGLRPDFGGGRPPRLDEDQRERLARVIGDWPELSAPEVRRLVDRAFDVSYSRRHAARLLDRYADEGERDRSRDAGVASAGNGGAFEAALARLVDGEPEGER